MEMGSRLRLAKFFPCNNRKACSRSVFYGAFSLVGPFLIVSWNVLSKFQLHQTTMVGIVYVSLLGFSVPSSDILANIQREWSLLRYFKLSKLYKMRIEIQLREWRTFTTLMKYGNQITLRLINRCDQRSLLLNCVIMELARFLNQLHMFKSLMFVFKMWQLLEYLQQIRLSVNNEQRIYFLFLCLDLFIHSIQ